MTGRRLVIGRDPDSDVVLDSPEVSWHHACLVIEGDRYVIQDTGSTNGTWVNEQRVESRTVSTRDVIRLGAVPLPWSRLLEQAHASGNTGLLVECLGVTVRAPSRRRALLTDVTFSATGGQVIAVIGPSGAGKSTLLRTLVGQLTPAQGSVLCNGESMSRSPELIWSWVGYVPQDDIIHHELTVREALYYAAQLRAPHERGQPIAARRVLTAAELCDLVPRLDQPISSLSGGERKRASVAVELLTQPPILVFDEPTSGLDPGLERDFMELCRRLADQGHLVVLTTHVTRSLNLCDRVLVIVDGRVGFFGPPSELEGFFGVSDPADLYGRLGSGEDWPSRFAASPTFRQYVARPVATSKPVPLPPSGHLADPVSQWDVLVRRYLSVLRGDRRNIVFLAIQAPIVGVINSAVFPRSSFDSPADLVHASGMLFTMVVSALWFGGLNSARDIVKEKGVYQRERMIGLSIGAYVLSKVAPLTVIGALQAGVLILMGGWRTDWYGHEAPHVVLMMWLILTLGVACGMSLGLLLSAFSTSPDQAMSLAPTVLLPQAMLSGIFKSVEQSPALVRGLSYILPARWSFAAAGHLLRLNERLQGTPFAPQASRALFDEPLSRSLAVLVVMFVILSALTWVALTAKRPEC